MEDKDKIIYKSELDPFYFGCLTVRTEEDSLCMSSSVNNDINFTFFIPNNLNGMNEIDKIISTLKQWKEDNFNVLKISELLRENYRQYIKKAELTDSKKEDKENRKYAQEIFVKLQSICPHEDVVRLNEAAESFQTIDDYFPALPEERKCLMCNLYELSLNKEPFQKLKTFKWIATKVKNDAQILKFVPEIQDPLNFSMHTCRHAAAGGL